MAKTKYVNSTQLQKELFKRTEGYAANVRAIYQNYLLQIINLVKGTELEEGKPFSFSEYGYSDEATAIFREMYSRMYQEIRNDVQNEWLLSNQHNDELVKVCSVKTLSMITTLPDSLSAIWRLWTLSLLGKLEEEG
ncbi:MAG: hypothetical protein ACLUVG_20985 [Phocaeicola vulgatus]